VTKGAVPENDKQQLKSVVKDDYILLSDEARQDDVTVNVKFKIVEWWQNLFHKEKETEQKLDGYVVKDSGSTVENQTGTNTDQTAEKNDQTPSKDDRTQTEQETINN